MEVKLPSDCKDYNWQEQFSRPIVHRVITQEQGGADVSMTAGWRLKREAMEMGLIKEDVPVNSIRDQQVEMAQQAKEAETIDKLVQAFVDAEGEAKQLLDTITRYKQAAIACAEVLGPDESKPVVAAIWQQLAKRAEKILDEAV